MDWFDSKSWPDRVVHCRECCGRLDVLARLYCQASNHKSQYLLKFELHSKKHPADYHRWENRCEQIPMQIQRICVLFRNLRWVILVTSQESTVLPQSFQLIAHILCRLVTKETHIQPEFNLIKAAAAHPVCCQSWTKHEESSRKQKWNLAVRPNVPAKQSNVLSLLSRVLRRVSTTR